MDGKRDEDMGDRGGMKKKWAGSGVISGGRGRRKQ